MTNIEPKILKGFRDFLPQTARKRHYVIDTLRSVFESYGFEPLETPALEYEEILTGKYGDEGDKLMYRFEDNGGRRVALRYDQTVPLARVIAQHQHELPVPFKRYQIQPVWRAENTQKGRFREFLQCDADIVGTDSPLADAEVIAMTALALKKLNFQSFKILINDRHVFSQLNEKGYVKDQELPTVLRSLDKIKKIGIEGVTKELQEKGFSPDMAAAIVENAQAMQKNDRVIAIFQALEKLGVDEKLYTFEPILARGLDYYTSTIFEIEVTGYETGSICGGGRYDNLIGMFADKPTPAVGFAFGFDRLMEAMEELNLFPAELQTAKVLVTIFNSELKMKSIDISSRLRSNNINTELYLDENAKMEKQLKYAHQKGIPYVVIIGPEEADKGVVQLKDMGTRQQQEVQIDELVKLISNS